MNDRQKNICQNEEWRKKMTTVSHSLKNATSARQTTISFYYFTLGIFQSFEQLKEFKLSFLLLSKHVIIAARLNRKTNKRKKIEITLTWSRSFFNLHWHLISKVEALLIYRLQQNTIDSIRIRIERAQPRKHLVDLMYVIKIGNETYAQLHANGNSLLQLSAQIGTVTNN